MTANQERATHLLTEVTIFYSLATYTPCGHLTLANAVSLKCHSKLLSIFDHSYCIFFFPETSLCQNVPNCSLVSCQHLAISFIMFTTVKEEGGAKHFSSKQQGTHPGNKYVKTKGSVPTCPKGLDSSMSSAPAQMERLQVSIASK